MQHKLRELFALYPSQPVLHTLSLYRTPSAYTAHTVYWVIIIGFIGMPCLDTSSMRNKIVCSMEYITGGTASKTKNNETLKPIYKVPSVLFGSSIIATACLLKSAICKESS